MKDENEKLKSELKQLYDNISDYKVKHDELKKSVKSSNIDGFYRAKEIETLKTQLEGVKNENKEIQGFNEVLKEKVDILESENRSLLYKQD